MPAIHNNTKADRVIGGLTFRAGQSLEVSDGQLLELAKNHVFAKWVKTGVLSPVTFSSAQLEAMRKDAEAKAKIAEAERLAAAETSRTDEQGRSAQQRAADMQAEIAAAEKRKAESASTTPAPAPETKGSGKK